MAGSEHRQGVAIRRRLRDRVRADRAVAARAVLHHHRLPPRFGELLSDGARDDIGAPARCERNDQADGARREIGCRVALRKHGWTRGEAGESGAGLQQFTTPVVHRSENIQSSPLANRRSLARALRVRAATGRRSGGRRRAGDAVSHRPGWRRVTGFVLPLGAVGKTLCRALRRGRDQSRSGRLCEARGFAGSLCGGVLAFAKAGNGAMVKRLHLGRAAESGILAARLAQSGFEGPDTILEGGFGFLETYCSESDPALLTAGLGERWETRTLGIKRYPCHVTAHTPVESVRALRDEHRIAADDVSAIRVRAGAKVVSHHAAHEAADVMALQYSVPFCVAIALVDDVDDPLAFGERALGNPQVHALARKVVCDKVECESGPDAPSSWASEGQIALRDGRTLERHNDDFLGTPT